MLDTDTKRRIDTARDILVGKVPDPKSQVEQITIALIYKFMDDMDQEAEELGGQRTFFSDGFQEVAWQNLMAPALGGHQVLNLYSDAIQKMNQNPNVPQLFRDIFKNAFLPYRDPETLKSFLKVINEFSYDHSEKLGDAFEYLLSVLGSQGDAGQFRTPRHIIDFIVDVVNPQKQERILDVACGTAGFLISAYKHIVKHNSSNYNPDEKVGAFEKSGVPLQEVTLNSTRYKGDLLTPDDRNRLAENIHGYDISPDMVRLSLVNMYLHSISNPKIDEYDTLTSDDRWNEYFDVILANPPFMSPKGGIRPHNRFSVTSKRSEVLFVDYIAEHLTPNGRAGVIVPEGIIFQSQNAYKQLRETLVKDYLFAVVSLPAGVFNPYSGVKTSILLLDKQLNKRTKNILFVKINNDGFGLGAQRRPIQNNDLPEAARLLKAYVQALRTGADFSVENFAALSPLLVEKERLAESGEFNLSGERYKTTKSFKTKYSLITIGESIDQIDYTNKIQKSMFLEIGKYPIIDQSEKFIAGYWNNEDDVFCISKPLVIFGDHTRIFKYIDFDFVLGADGVKILQPIDKFDPKFYYYILKSLQIKNLGYSRHYKLLKDLKIPLPPLDIQREIVAEIEGYQKIIDGARQVVEHYKPQITIDPEWEMVELGEVIELISGQHIQKSDYNNEGEGAPYLTGPADFGDHYPIISKWSTKPKVFSQKDDILITVKGSGIGKINILNIDQATISRQLMAIRVNKINSKFLYSILSSKFSYFQELGKGCAIPGITRKDIQDLKIPLPDLATQERIVAQIEQEQALVNANKELIKLYEAKIKERIARVWGE